MEFDTITYLARAYFHQDFDLIASTPEGILEEFRRREDVATVEQLRRELDVLAARRPSDERIKTVWMASGGSSFEPDRHGMNYGEWLEKMQRVFDANR
ncbi:contact-dependent growth inhibition system immunity protein [Hamadaea sp. NPDC051192]|uniref:contact-dependent growth inhibition system immunity protein n=1 Tax=Hamadaea sp. NPDC051192 TaxID=3154940 RepID=UPI003447DE12